MMNTRKQCAYCGCTDRKITREHLWPRSLHQRLQKARGAKQHLFWLSRLAKVVTTEPQLRDVCDVCNNGALSCLDAYICVLWDQFFSHIHKCGEMVTFSYDYHLLCRWLLKQCYNSARIHEFDKFVYPPLTPYILNGSVPPIETRLFLQLAPPGLISVQELEDMELPHDTPLRWEPEGHRVGFLYFTFDSRKKLLRAVHLRSYSFFLAFFQPGATESEINEFVSVFTLQNKYVSHLLPGSDSIKLLCDGIDAWHSIQGVRRKLVSQGSLRA